MNTKKILILIFLTLISSSLFSNEYSFRKYSHVKEFYYNIYEDAINIAIKNYIPLAALMAIAGLESGYGSGYLSQITGNILSLGAFKDDVELPSLYLPYSKSKKRVLFDPKEISLCSKNDLLYKQRPKSLKRDYRPPLYAGSVNNLELLKNDYKLKEKAYKDCMNDFATRWITRTSKIKVFRDTKVWIEKKVRNHGIGILFDKKINEIFIEKIGGVPYSFNYRSSWPKKAKLIMYKVGLVQLSNDIYVNKKSFNYAWSNK